MYITVSEAAHQKIEDSRESWAEVARKFGWYFEPFYIQVWIDEFGEVVDTVGHKGMRDSRGDILISDELDDGVE
ncbi:MAG TPA: hypothetical protein PL051_03535 [Candidatus Saccharibacteria bacterium]|nr:hypothetical protein [Candidatus Saccharibacteria bacterium]